MSLFSATDRKFSQAVSQLAHCNPFLPERIDLEREALGRQFEESILVWSRLGAVEEDRPNVRKIAERVENLVTKTREKLTGCESIADDDQRIYKDLVSYLLYYRYWEQFAAIHEATDKRQHKVRFWSDFHRDYTHFLDHASLHLDDVDRAPHLFACLYQVRRAFHFVYNFIVGGSLPAAKLRARIWQSVFTHDLRRYRRSLYSQMGDITTLVTGPSGTGKELVARAIGMSRYLPFDEQQQQFATDANELFFAVNLSALSPGLIESELFGHRRGSFTGAIADRAGWLEECPPLGTVFLDEIGELDTAIQVKLLRVLQARTFQRLGDTADRSFAGKIVAATNRDLGREMLDGNFREDLYYRLCADMITTPSLAEQLADNPDDLQNLVLFLARQICAEEAQPLADEVVRWIETHLGPDYAWPGNIRELEQCVRNILIRQEYHPVVNSGSNGTVALTADQQAAVGEAPGLAANIAEGNLTAEEMLQLYCTLIYAREGSYEATARRLKLDRRTVKSKVDLSLLGSTPEAT